MSALGIQVAHQVQGKCLTCGWQAPWRGETPYEHYRRTGHPVSQRDTTYTLLTPVE